MKTSARWHGMAQQFFPQCFLMLVLLVERGGAGAGNGKLLLRGGTESAAGDGRLEEQYAVKREEGERQWAEEEMRRSLAALMDFKRCVNSTNGSLADWNEKSRDYCNWTGITCGGSGQVVELRLQNAGLRGTITRMLANLTWLETVDLSRNQLTGGIPADLPTRLETVNLWNNFLDGEIPESLSKLKHLRYLTLDWNSLEGQIPRMLWNCTSLYWLGLSQNSLHGRLPPGLGQLPLLSFLDLENNSFHGPIPPALGNCSRLATVSLAFNSLSHAIPSELGSISFQTNDPDIINGNANGQLSLMKNSLSGPIPRSLGNCSGIRLLFLQFNTLTNSLPEEIGQLAQLVQLELEQNQLTGEIPNAFGNLSQLNELWLNKNSLTGTIPESLTLLPNLSILELSSNGLQGSIPPRISSSGLQGVYLGNNSLSGMLPSSVANCTQLIDLQLPNNLLKGNIPPSLGNLTRLQNLDLHHNYFTGSIPRELADCSQLYELNLGTNKLSGRIPSTLGNLGGSLQHLNLQRNELQGPIPRSLGNATHLLDIDLSDNNLNGSIPVSIAYLINLATNLNLSHNSLTGPIPQSVGKLVMVQNIDISANHLHGEIPDSFTSCLNLRILNLSFNTLNGTIPPALGKLTELLKLDLSVNKLSGEIPLSLTELPNLQFFNVSQNQLEGKIPTAGAFSHLTASSFLDNPELCGRPLSVDCYYPGRKPKGLFIAEIVCGILGAALFVFFSVLWRYKSRLALSSIKMSPPEQDLLKKFSVTRVTPEELHIATNGYGESNLLGVGASSKVYKAKLRDGTMVAVKRLNLEENEKEFERRFYKECEIMGKIRHRNLVPILSTCCNLEMKAIVLEYMPNGSLENLLFGGDGFHLEWKKIFDIALDVANALVYLHYDYGVPIIHCDLKPSNILLDEHFIAHVADFGIAKLLSPNQVTSSTTHFRGSFGYIAPECAQFSHYSTKSDVYSYGVVLLCMLTRRQPTSNLFDHGIDMPTWVKMFLPNMFLEAIDPTLCEQVKGTQCENEVSLVLKVALLCTNQNPYDRPTSRDALDMLVQIMDKKGNSSSASIGSQMPLLDDEDYT